MSTRTALSADQRRALLSSPAGWLACGFGAGLAPVAQGTFGSLAAMLPWLALRELPLSVYVLVLLVAFGIGVWACTVAGHALQVADHRSLVWDEFVGQWVALLPLLIPGFLPPGVPALVLAMFAGFGLFRLFDVWKPWPISWLDGHVKGGLGVMVDDLLAGIFAAAILALLVHFAR